MVLFVAAAPSPAPGADDAVFFDAKEGKTPGKEGKAADESVADNSTDLAGSSLDHADNQESSSAEVLAGEQQPSPADTPQFGEQEENSVSMSVSNSIGFYAKGYETPEDGSWVSRSVLSGQSFCCLVGLGRYGD